MKYDVYESPSMGSSLSGKQVGKEIGAILGKGFQGFLDWIGLGKQVGKYMNTAGGINREKAISDIRAKLSELAAKDQLDYDRLMDEVNSLATAGFNLSGVAADVMGRYKTNKRKELSDFSKKMKMNEIERSKISSDVDKAEEMSTELSPTSSEDSKNILERAKSALGIG